MKRRMITGKAGEGRKDNHKFSWPAHMSRIIFLGLKYDGSLTPYRDFS
jgi:hypothetical protein